MMEYLPLKLSDTMDIIVELDNDDQAVYFHAQFSDNNERASSGYTSDLLDTVYSYGKFDNELEAIPVVAEMWQQINQWIETI